MFSQTVEYALRAMAHMASIAPAAGATRSIAAETKVPGAYLAKVLQSMRRAGLINSRRGVGGGVTLARPAKKINLWEVVNAVEPMKRGASSKGGRANLGPLNKKLDEALGVLEKSLSSVSLADVAAASPRSGKAKAARGKRS
jgi:Rrf2 family protein